MLALISILAIAAGDAGDCKVSEVQKKAVARYVRVDKITGLESGKIHCDDSEFYGETYKPYTYCKIYINHQYAYLTLESCSAFAKRVNMAEEK